MHRYALEVQTPPFGGRDSLARDLVRLLPYAERTATTIGDNLVRRCTFEVGLQLPSNREIYLTVVGHPDSDADEQAELAAALRQELIALDDFENVRAAGAIVPAGAKAGDGVAWAQLVVQVGSLPLLIEALRVWSRRHRGSAVTISIEGDSLELEAATEQERAAIVSAWLERHQQGPPGPA